MPAPSPQYLTPTWRYAGDDWSGSNALAYTVYSIQPIYQLDSDGNIEYDSSGNPIVVTPGTPVNLTGFTIIGKIQRRVPSRYAYSTPGASLPSSLPLLTLPTGAIVGDPTLGKISLSLASSYTDLPRQKISDYSVSPDLSLLIAQPIVIDASGNKVTSGLQPLFVY